MKAKFRKFLSIWYTARAVRFGQKSVDAARKATLYSDDPEAKIAAWVGYWFAWLTLANNCLSSFRELAQTMSEEQPKVTTHPNGVEETDWTETKRSQEALKMAVPALITKDTIH